MTDYSPFKQPVVDQLRLFLGDEALTAYERCGRSMQRLSNLARESSHPGYRLLAAGLALAQEALAEPMREAPESRGGGRDHGAQPCEQGGRAMDESGC